MGIKDLAFFLAEIKFKKYYLSIPILSYLVILPIFYSGFVDKTIESNCDKGLVKNKLVSDYSLMTKKDLILEKSLELFSSKGFKGTSTRSIADAAEVSEGLIFKHFKSKNGLLSELLKIGASKSTPEIEKIRNSDDPKSMISSCIRLFLNIKKKDYPYWRLYYASGFEDNGQTIGLEPILKKTVMEAFKKLGYVNTSLEAELLLNSLDGLMIKMLTADNYNPEPQVSLILKKYRLS